MALADVAKKAAAPIAEGNPDGASFEKKDISSAIPPEAKDAVDRIVAAGMKIMFNPATRQHMMQGIQSKEPVPKKIAENVTGLLLLVDQKAKQAGQTLPGPAIFPAAYELAAQAGEVLVKAGQPVSHEDFNSAVQLLYVMIGKKMGGTDEQIMGAAAKHVEGAVADEGAAAGEPVPPEGGAAPVDPNAAAAPPVDPTAAPTAPAGAPPITPTDDAAPIPPDEEPQ